jgi:hypothetical protein
VARTSTEEYRVGRVTAVWRACSLERLLRTIRVPNRLCVRGYPLLGIALARARRFYTLESSRETRLVTRDEREVSAKPCELDRKREAKP